MRLAQAGAFEGFDKNRRGALWSALGVRVPEKPELALGTPDVRPKLETLGPLETVVWDYDSTGHSPRGHPLSALRDELAAQGLPDASTVRSMRDGKRVRYAGMVICRQRPGTAKGVVFMTMEDETGFVNVVLWESVYSKFRILAKTSSFLGVSGRLQVESNVVHVIAESLWKPEVRARPGRTHSRDFH